MKLTELTERQLDILHFVHDFTKDNGYPPSLREIGERFGIRSTNGVNDHLLAIEAKGYISREMAKSRAIRIVHLPKRAA